MMPSDRGRWFSGIFSANLVPLTHSSLIFIPRNDLFDKNLISKFKSNDNKQINMI